MHSLCTVCRTFNSLYGLRRVKDRLQLKYSVITIDSYCGKWLFVCFVLFGKMFLPLQ